MKRKVPIGKIDNRFNAPEIVSDPPHAAMIPSLVVFQALQIVVHQKQSMPAACREQIGPAAKAQQKPAYHMATLLVFHPSQTGWINSLVHKQSAVTETANRSRP